MVKNKGIQASLECSSQETRFAQGQEIEEQEWREQEGASQGFRGATATYGII